MTTIPNEEILPAAPQYGDQIVTITKVRGGQPQPYADHEDVDLVSFFVMRLDGWKVADWTGTGMEEQQIKHALGVLGAADLQTADEHFAAVRAGRFPFQAYLDYAKVVAPGVVEVRTVRPYLD